MSGVQDLIERLVAGGLLSRLLRVFFATDTYTPVYRGATTPGTTTYTTQAGWYVRLGPLVVAGGQVVWSAATGTGEAEITVPFTAATYSYPVLMRLNAVTYAGDSFQAVLVAATDAFRIEGVTSNAAPTRTAVEAGGSVTFLAAYLTS